MFNDLFIYFIFYFILFYFFFRGEGGEGGGEGGIDVINVNISTIKLPLGHIHPIFSCSSYRILLVDLFS